ncbi:MAG: SMP-30/gluconolactonase/LRE family protein [Pseudomonadota bacterium]
MADTRVLIDGLYFGEGPRWRDGRLWFSDFYDYAIKSVDLTGNLRLEHQFEDYPSGLGWLPDGRLLVVSMKALKVLRQEGDKFAVHADLSSISRFKCNEMLVDAQGRAYVGDFGFDLDAQIERVGVEGVLADHPTSSLVRVDPDGSVHLAAQHMHFPNGTVVTPDGKTLIIAESLGMCLTAFDVADDGSLTNRRIWANVGASAPDGICLDADDNVWFADAIAPQCVLISQGGEVLNRVVTRNNCYACMLGGKDGRDLFMLTAESSDASAAASRRTGQIELYRALSPRAGYP